jgi:DNA methylase
MTAKVYHADSALGLELLASESADALVTDPPAGISLLGKNWDGDRGGRNFWIAWLRGIMEEALRVLKPGAHGLVWALPRTAHWTTTALEDAGFEVRDVVVHCFGTGMPKSLDVSKAIDKKRHDRDQVLEVTLWIARARDAAGLKNGDIDRAFGFAGMAGHWTSQKTQPAVPTLEQVPQLLEVLGVSEDSIPERIRHLLYHLNGRKGQPGENWLRREVTGEYAHASGASTWRAKHEGGNLGGDRKRRDKPASGEAARWQGWGTCLKPAGEHWILVRKPFPGTVADNVRRHGVGALNVDATRIEMSQADRDFIEKHCRPNTRGQASESDESTCRRATHEVNVHEGGRWPTNLILDADAAAGMEENFPGGSRFFYVPKPSGKERPDWNTHPTVKPVELMQYLVRMLTPPGGLVLDPFAGSGTTAVACIREGFDFVGFEREAEYVEIIRRRIKEELFT